MKTYYSPSPADSADLSGAGLGCFSFGFVWGPGLRFNLLFGWGFKLKINYVNVNVCDSVLIDKDSVSVSV